LNLCPESAMVLPSLHRPKRVAAAQPQAPCDGVGIEMRRAHDRRVRWLIHRIPDGDAVGTQVTRRPPHRPGRAELPHPVLALGRDAKPLLRVRRRVPSTHRSGSESGTRGTVQRFLWLRPFPPPPPPGIRPLCLDAHRNGPLSAHQNGPGQCAVMCPERGQGDVE
jgi:hypothetical protein